MSKKHPKNSLLPPAWVGFGRRVAQHAAEHGWRAPAQALFTPRPRPIWRWFWQLLALAFVLRLLAAWHGHWFWRVDEVFQYLEQAHRVVFGYGAIPWEYYYGARSWLTPGMAMPPLFLAKWLGVEHPWTYATMVNGWNALLSMSIPISAYFITRRMLSEQAARWALIFTCFWYEFIVLASRNLSEVYSTYFFMAGLALAAGVNEKRWLTAGFLFGVALSFRPHYAPLVGIIGIVGVWLLPRRCAVFAVLGGVAALLLWGLLDKLTWGGWWVSIFNYAEYLPILFSDLHEGLFWWHHIENLAIASFGLYLLMLLLALLCFHRLWLVWVLVAVPLFLYHLRGDHAYSNVFIFLPLLWILMAGVMMEVISKLSKDLVRFAAVGVFTVSLAGASGSLPKLATIFFTADFFSIQPDLQTAYQLHDAIERKDNTVLLRFEGRGSHHTGSFYALHHNIPVLLLFAYPGEGGMRVLVREPRHHRIWAESGFLPLQRLATHILAPRGANFGDAKVVDLADGNALYILRTPPTYPVQDKWVYDHIDISSGEEEKMPPRELTPYNPTVR